MKPDTLTESEIYFLRMLREKRKRFFYGEIELKFHNGEIKNIAIHTSMNMTGLMTVYQSEV